MPAYWIARSRVNDPETYKKYADQVPGILAQYGGRFLARGGRSEVLEGTAHFGRFVIIEFPSFEDGIACFRSDAYKAAAEHRRGGAGEVEVVMVEAI